MKVEKDDLVDDGAVSELDDDGKKDDDHTRKLYISLSIYGYRLSLLQVTNRQVSREYG